MATIYKPTGKAGEYSTWACNLYNGCSNNCSYCFNNHSIMSKTLGGTNVRLKKPLIDEKTAFQIFQKELDKSKEDIIKDGGLHFNFVSDPCLPQTLHLNWTCITYAISLGVTCQVLTKRADWLNSSFVQYALSQKNLIRVGFSLTGCNDLEPGASTNEERINAMQSLYKNGISTWASIEPIIEPNKSLEMVAKTITFCDHFKIGLLSGKKNYTPQDIKHFIKNVEALHPKSVYWKQSIYEFIKGHYD